MQDRGRGNPGRCSLCVSIAEHMRGLHSVRSGSLCCSGTAADFTCLAAGRKQELMMPNKKQQAAMPKYGV